MKRYFDTVTNLYPFFFFGSFKNEKKKMSSTIYDYNYVFYYTKPFIQNT